MSKLVFKTKPLTCFICLFSNSVVGGLFYPGISSTWLLEHTPEFFFCFSSPFLSVSYVKSSPCVQPEKNQAPRSGPSLFFKCAHRGLLLYSSMALKTSYVLALGCLPPICLCFFSLTCSKQNSQPPHLSQKATPPFSWLKMIKPWDSSQHFSSYNTHKILVILPWKLNQKSGHLCC